jgi:signal transduction histidine kinase
MRLIVSELALAAQELWHGFARFLPRLMVMVIIAFAGWVVAYVVKVLLRSVLRLVKFDRLSENAGASQLLTRAALPSPSELVSRFVFWIVWLGFILMGVGVLGIFGLQDQIAHFFLFLPRLFIALLILFFGMLAASFFSRAILLAAVNSNLPSPRLVSVSIRGIIIIFALSMCFEELGIAQETMLLAFGIAFGAMMLGFAIAFGMGGRDIAQAFLERKLTRHRKEESEDELSPL